MQQVAILVEKVQLYVCVYVVYTRQIQYVCIQVAQ